MIGTRLGELRFKRSTMPAEVNELKRGAEWTRMTERAVRCDGWIKRCGGRCKCRGGFGGSRTGETCRHDESR